MKNILVTRSSMPSLDEYVEEIRPIWDSHWLTNMGEKHKKLQTELEKYLGIPHVALYTNGHLALENVIAALNLPKGGEVITTPFTFASTTHAIVRNGLIPVFCDVNENDYTIDVTKIEDLITDRTVAIVPVHVYAISRAAAEEALEPLTQQPMTPAEVNHARRQHNLPLDSGAETEQPAQPKQKPINFRITDDDLGAGGPKTKYKANVEAIRVLQTLDAEQRQATAEEQEILSRYVGWGGIPQAFDENNAEWSKEYAELQSLLTADEYKEARASTLNAFYTSPTVIKAMYEALDNMGLSKGNVLEPSCGVGNFMGLVPDSMEKIRMYGVELDNISGRIAQQLYQKNKIAVQGFETMQFPDSFFDCVVGNVPFGNYKVPDKRYDRHNFLIHDYFIAKSLDLVRPGGVVAVVTSSGTMDKKDSSVREYLANRADLVGAIRLPNNAFQRNANTGVVADILFLQKRDRAAVERADWVDLGETPEGYSIN